MWQKLLDGGDRVTAIGGSGRHHADRTIGRDSDGRSILIAQVIHITRRYGRGATLCPERHAICFTSPPELVRQYGRERKMPDIVIVGEGMVELSGDSAGGWRLGQGGDTMNSAIHLARLGRNVAYMTALGDDHFSHGLRERWAAEGIDTSLVLTDPGRHPGLYAITNDADGERHFTYWRGDSAARRLFALPGIGSAAAAAARADLLLFSMISLAILPPEGRVALFALAREVRRRGGRVAFDTNYRPALWPDAATARAVHRAALELADIGLPTIEDEIALTGAADDAAVLSAWRAAGVGEVVVKQGADGCTVDGERIAPSARLAPVDTSGAGDAFNAGYLHARLGGAAPADAARAGHRLAGWVVMNRGAVPAVTADAPYDALRAAATAG